MFVIIDDVKNWICGESYADDEDKQAAGTTYTCQVTLDELMAAPYYMEIGDPVLVMVLALTDDNI